MVIVGDLGHFTEIDPHKDTGLLSFSMHSSVLTPSCMHTVRATRPVTLIVCINTLGQ